MLTEKALTDLGAEKCQALVPSTNFQEVTAWQEETEEALVVLTYLGGHPMSPFTDVRPYLNLCDKGATLSPKALLEIAGLMRACRTARAALVTDRENTPRLKEKAGLLGSFRNLEDDITTAIISEDEIADRASVELANIRRHLRGATERVKERLNAMIRSAACQKYLQDPIITVRNGRYVLPVKAEYRSQRARPGARPVRQRRHAVHRAHGGGGDRQRAQAVGRPRRSRRSSASWRAFSDQRGPRCPAALAPRIWSCWPSWTSSLPRALLGREMRAVHAQAQPRRASSTSSAAGIPSSTRRRWCPPICGWAGSSPRWSSPAPTPAARR